MIVDPGMELLEEDMIQSFGDNLTPGGDYPIDVPASGGVIIQGPNGCYGIKLDDGNVYWFDSEGNPITDPWG